MKTVKSWSARLHWSFICLICLNNCFKAKSSLCSQCTTIIHCHIDIFSRLGERTIRGQRAPRVVPLRPQVRGHHSLLLTYIWPTICWSLIVSIPDFKSQKNVWDNISVSLAKGRINNYGTMLWWNLSAPCRLSGEVWLCHGQGIRQQLSNEKWSQNKEGLWVRQLIPNFIAFIRLCLFL